MAEGEAARPSDEEIWNHQSSIKEDIALRHPLVANREPLRALAEEYEAGSPTFQQKIQHLSQEYARMRRTRGDGNCFFRSFLFAYLEHLLLHPHSTQAASFRDRIAASEQRLEALGYSAFTYEDFSSALRELVDGVDGSSSDAPALTEQSLLQYCQDPDCSNYAVMFLRFATSAEIQHRAEFFHPFLPSPTALALAPADAAVQFCRSAVEPMGQESDHVHITALTDALGVPVRIVYLDRSAGQANFHDFLPEGEFPSGTKDSSSCPPVVLLYRPGHYDILYRKASE